MGIMSMTVEKDKHILDKLVNSKMDKIEIEEVLGAGVVLDLGDILKGKSTVY